MLTRTIIFCAGANFLLCADAVHTCFLVKAIILPKPRGHYSWGKERQGRQARKLDVPLGKIVRAKRDQSPSIVI